MQASFGVQATLQVREVERPSLREQASIYYNASILIQMHGAALGMHFPYQAVKPAEI